MKGGAKSNKNIKITTYVHKWEARLLGNTLAHDLWAVWHSSRVAWDAVGGRVTGGVEGRAG